jgi:hypothetical protein
VRRFQTRAPSTGAGRRISVQNIVIWHEWMDWSAYELDLTLAEIYTALAYYYNNPQEIDQSIKDSQDFVEEMKNNIPSKVMKAEAMHNHVGFL